MTVNNYTLATKPYTRGFGDKTTTVVEIRLQDGNRYTTNQRELAGDRTQDQEDVLIQAVLDMVKSELDPANAIVKAQQDLESTKTKQDVSLLPAMKVGTTYFEDDLVTITDPEYVEKNGEGNNVIVQINREFEYTGQSIKDLEGELSRNGVLAVWRWIAPKADSI